jgi:hypothetical protein
MMEEQPEGELLKQAALEIIRQTGEARQLMLQEHAHSFRWLIASLLAINGGAAIAVLSNIELHVATKAWSGGFFAAGIFAALLIGVISQRASQRVLTPLSNVTGYWLRIAHGDERDEEAEAGFAEQLKPALRLGVMGQILGWMSALLFGAGVVMIGLDIVRQDAKKSEIVCLDTNGAETILDRHDR